MLTLAEFDAVLQRYLTGHSLPGEQQLVEQWSQQLGQGENQLLAPEQLAETREAMWQRIVALTAEPVAGGKVVALAAEVVPARRPWWRPALGWAAAILLTVGMGSWWQAHLHTMPPAAPRWVEHTNTGQPSQTLRLTDGSRVTLYAGSTLRYRPDSASARREVYLTGQGFFQVVKNPARPFLVYTEQLITTVLGTSFLVTAYAHQANKVAVREGRVAVQRRAGANLAATPARPAAAVVLLPNQQAQYAAATQALARTLVAEPVRLQPQPLSFRKQPVAEVLTALEQAYGVNIVYDPRKLVDCTITITFSDEPLYEQLDALCKALNASYKQANDAQIIFESRGCKLSG